MLNKKALFLLSSLFLTACGYHLRDAADLPPELNHVYLQGESPSLREQFNKTLKSSAGQLESSAKTAKLVINIVKEDLQRRVLSLSERGRANEFGLDYRLEYELSDANNKVLLEREAIEIRREYFNNQQDIIAKDNEEKVIRSEMLQQAVRSIISRARVILANKKHAS
jgi:LPS-assembly lipoprotein